MKRLILATAIGLLFANAARGEIVTKSIEYRHGETALEGYLAYDSKIKDPQPGVILVHEWWGLTDHMKNMTNQVAEMGYVAFAIDLYGKGVVTDKTDKAGQLSGQFKDNDAFRRERLKAGFETFSTVPQVDKTRIGAIGFCFGGTCVLHMAYSGLDVKGVVSFHGSLVPPGESDVGKIKAKILVLHGADDPLVSAESIKAFQDGVRKARADWQMLYFGNAVHSFTNPGADKVGIEGVKYDARTDARSRQQMKLFFDEVLAKK